MSSSESRFAHPSRNTRALIVNTGIAKTAAAGIALLAAGCSADVARFDSPAFNLTGGGSSSGPTPSASVRRNLGADRPAEVAAAPAGPSGGSYGGSSYAPPRPNRDNGVQVAALPEAQRPANPAPVAPITQSEPRRAPQQAAVQPAAAPVPVASNGAKGEQIEVQHGDTLYGLSRKYKVSLNELMQVNSLQNPSLKPGQKLYLPAAKGRKTLIKPATTAHAPAGAAPAALPAAVAPAATAAVDASTWTGTYTVKAGDSLYALSRQHKIKLTELQQVNGISDVRKVRPGTVLKVPGNGSSPAPVAAAEPAEPAARAEPRVASGPASSAKPTMLNGDAKAAEAKAAAETKVAALTDRATDAAPAVAPAATEPAVAEKGDKIAAAAPAAASAAGATGKLRWPVKGKVIAPFGPRSDGTHNDGVNLAVPQGTEVHAAEAGTVAYAGSELKGYGNLVLVRHDNGWVTAYAHNDELLVKRGDRVKRGQLLAKAGKSGQVDQPQVHFELRQGSKPVDPTPHMERL